MKKISLPLAGLAMLPAITVGAQVKKASPADKFNVVFIISDQHKLSVTGCYGDKIVKTPNIDALARSGVMFTRVYTPSPLSAPARAAIMTGTYPATNGVLLHRMLIEKNGKIVETEAGKVRDGYKIGMTTWGEAMKQGGYTTAAIGKMHVHGELQKGVDKDYPQGNDMGFDFSDLRFYTSFPGGHYSDWKGNPDYNARYREIQQYTPYRAGNNLNQLLKPTLVQDKEDIFDFAVATVSENFMDECVKKGEPFFLHAGLEKPHKPWSTLQEYYDMYTAENMVIPPTQRDWHENGRYPFVKKGTHSSLTDPQQIRNSMVAYYACVTEMDEAVGRIVERTKQLGVYDKTIFVYTTDHGEHLFEHGFHEKHNMFEDAVNVPFIISCPALLPQGVVCASLGSTIDVLPTIAELTGQPVLEQWEGRSLLSQIGAARPWSDRVIYSEFYQTDFELFPKRNVPLKMYLDNKYKYVYSHGMIDQLYDAQGNDPYEMTNLALDPKYADIVERYRFLTLCDWVISLAPLMKADISSGAAQIIEWKPVQYAADYTVWRSESPDPASAVKAGRTSGTSFAPTGEGAYYWVTANWNLTRNGQRKENVPMATQGFPETLPISEMLTLK